MSAAPGRAGDEGLVTETIRLAVLGDPLAHTRSPDLYRAGLAAVSLAGESSAIRTGRAELGERLAELARLGFRGVNLTHPLKASALAHLARVSEASRCARSVNTVGFAADGWWGDTTDGPGLLDLLEGLGRAPARERTVLLGGGGAARSLALALGSSGARGIVVSVRRPEAVERAWQEIPGARLTPWRSAEERRALSESTLVIHATPLADADGPAPLADIPPRALLLDLVYGEQVTPWVLRARAEGREAYDGLGLLVYQARRSLTLWLSRPVPLDPLARAVGWPR